MTGFEYSTLREKVAVELRNSILSGEFKVGEKINEVAVAQKLSISRGPVREALRQIEQEGLVEYFPNRGCTVKTLAQGNIYEFYLIRSTLEILAINMYNGKMSSETIAKLKHSLAELAVAAEKQSIVDVVRIDEEFHEIIVKESQSKRLYQIWKSLQGENVAIYYTMEQRQRIPFKVLERNHRWIVEKFEKGDLLAITDCIKEHYLSVPQNYDI